MLGDPGIRLNLFDTAGVRDVGEHGDAVEAEGIRRSWKKLEEAGMHDVIRTKKGIGYMLV